MRSLTTPTYYLCNVVRDDKLFKVRGEAGPGGKNSLLKLFYIQPGPASPSCTRSLSSRSRATGEGSPPH